MRESALTHRNFFIGARDSRNLSERRDETIGESCLLKAGLVYLLRRLYDLIRKTQLGLSISQSLCKVIICISATIPATAQQTVVMIPAPGDTSGSLVVAPDTQPGSISGTVSNVKNEIVPSATVVLEGPAPGDRRTIVTKENGSFEFSGLSPGVPYHVAISAAGFVSWTSPPLVLNPGQFLFLTSSKLEIAGGISSVTVYSSAEQIAVEQIKVEETQRVFGIVPNFYVVYDHDAVPLTTKLKYKLAFRTSVDPVTFVGAAILAGINQAGDTPDYVEGAKGYGQRLGAVYTDSTVDIMFGGAIFPSLFHQDPRYFYQGTGSTKSRVFHALSSPFICKGDSGRWQPNYSSIGGDLTTGAISNLYYPTTNRGPGLVFGGALISTGGRMVNGLIQEFILRRFTPSARNNSP